jgi:hypothetical protein
MVSLSDNLKQAGKVPVPLAFPDGSRLLVLPESGRLLGLFMPGTDENVLWTNPALATAESATAYFTRPGWPNPGGDRTWLAPEIELFIGDLARPAQTYAVPAALDPGHWTLSSSTHTELRLTQTTCVRLHRARQDVRVRLEKVLRPAANPLPDAGLDYAGYSQVTTLEVEAPPDSAVRLGIWNLLQLPSPGTMLIPTRATTHPQRVFGALSDSELTVTPHGVRWEMAAPGADAKIAIKAQPLTGRVGYLHATPCYAKATQGKPDTLDLVVREFTVVPGGDYVDALWDPPHETGWAFQACCIRNGAERFNELEYHAPALSAENGLRSSRDESRVWAFRGPQEAVAQAASLLLGGAVTG